MVTIDPGIQRIVQRATNLLTRCTAPEDPVNEIELAEVMREIEAAISQNSAAGRTLGPLLGRLRFLCKQAVTSETTQWLPLAGGTLAIGHRPRLKSLPQLKQCGLTCVVTLLSAAEGAEGIGAEAQRSGLNWIWFPMESAAPPPPSRSDDLRTVFHEIRDALQQGGRVYLHCSAGIHRTGMIAFALLRFLGQSPDDASMSLIQLRKQTAAGVGDQRIAWANQFADGD